MTLSDFIPIDGQLKIVEAIKKAEQKTSGEIKVHVTPVCRFNVVKRAIKVFELLEMERTRFRNAVLIYIAFQSKKFAIIGDVGIDKVVPENYWDKEKEKLAASLAEGRQVDGLCEIIARIGDSLSTYFPADREDINEISNEISYED